MVAKIIERHGTTPVTVAEAAPTPAFAYAVLETKADGLIAAMGPRGSRSMCSRVT
jgi:hypothetical protein